jgi:5-methyltetrahydrofolate--homocysteine methyltransferase
MTTLTSRSGSVQFGPGQPTLLIGDLSVKEQGPELVVELQAGRFDRLLELVRLRKEAGAEVIDILLAGTELDEVALLPAIATAIHTEVGCPLSLDSRDPAALSATLSALRPYKTLINSVSAEPDSLATLLPIAKEFGAAIVGMPIGPRYGLSRTVEHRLAEARLIVEAAARAGLARDDIVLDAICLATAAAPDSMRVTLETLAAFHRELNVATILGIGNAGFGMPNPACLDLAYLMAAVPWGLDAALVDAQTPGLVPSVHAIDFLTGRDPYGKRYLRHYRAHLARVA